MVNKVDQYNDKYLASIDARPVNYNKVSNCVFRCMEFSSFIKAKRWIKKMGKEYKGYVFIAAILNRDEKKSYRYEDIPF